jgi:Zn-dependent peptidase ImmA (M78 family)
VYCRAEDVGVDPEARALEREANIFAANLVMPEEAVQATGGENRFGVSNEALAWRLYNLKLGRRPRNEERSN